MPNCHSNKFLAAAALALTAGCSPPPEPTAPATSAPSAQLKANESNPLRDAYFGDLRNLSTTLRHC